MSVSDIYRIFVRFGSDTLEGKERYTVGIGKTNLTVILLDSIISQYKAIKMIYCLKIMQSYFQPICRNSLFLCKPTNYSYLHPTCHSCSK